MIVLLILALLILLVFFVPYGVDASYAQSVLSLYVKAGPLRFRLLPKKPKTEKQLEREKKREEKKAAKKRAKAEKKAKAKESLEETQKVKEKKPLDLDFLLALAKMAVRAIRRFFRSFTIERLELTYVVATPDPYDTATQYAYLCGGLSALEPMAGSVIHVKKKDIRVGMDFTTEKALIEGRLVLTLQLFRIVHLAVAFGVEFIRWKIQQSRLRKAGSDERTDYHGR